ncbi:hypothetical protein M3Y95_01220100 [Aphelenchoides besseyi]|nr:hypothetical protein M3Y95_01220100 [Aphelenchoides besseyi]
MRSLITFFLLFIVVSSRKVSRKFAKPQIIPFVRQNESELPSINLSTADCRFSTGRRNVDRITTPETEVALCYETYASTNGKVMDQIVLFKPKNCGKRKTRFFNSSKSKTLKNLNQHTDNRRLFGGQIFADRIALGFDSALMQNLSFVVADSKDSCKFAGLWPMDPIAKTDVWEPLLKHKPKPVVTITADTSPKINGVWSTGQLMIGSYNKFLVGDDKVSWAYVKSRGHLDLNSDRLEFGSVHYRELLRYKKIENKDGRSFVDCSSNWTIGYEMPKKEYVILAKTEDIFKFETLYVEPTKKKAGGRCELKLGVWKSRKFGFKAPAQLLDYYCVHQKYEIDDGNENFERFEGWTKVSFSVRR